MTCTKRANRAIQTKGMTRTTRVRQSAFHAGLRLREFVQVKRQKRGIFMRIIAGEFKGRRLETPEDNQIRPTTDKVKEAMFSIISPWLCESVCADLFSGTGNLGLEAISRGAARCYFADSSRKSVSLIRRNIDYCKAGDRAVLFPGDYAAAIGKINEKVDIFLLDPPYEAGYYEDCLEKIKESGILAEEGIIVAEHRSDLKLPEDLGGFTKFKERKYGNIVLSLYG